MHSLVYRMVNVYSPLLAGFLVGCALQRNGRENWVVAETNADGTARLERPRAERSRGHSEPSNTGTAANNAVWEALK